jgi:hypothetical protein
VELVWSGGLELGGHHAADRESFRGHGWNVVGKA